MIANTNGSKSSINRVVSIKREEMMAFDRDAVLARIRLRLERDFPLKCRVKLSKQGRAALIVPKKHFDRRGTVIGYSHGVSPNVLWDGRKTPKGYHPSFLECVR